MMLPTLNPHFIPSFLMFCLFTLISCTEEYDECFYLTDEIVTRVYPLNDFNQIETFVKGS